MRALYGHCGAWDRARIYAFVLLAEHYCFIQFQACLCSWAQLVLAYSKQASAIDQEHTNTELQDLQGLHCIMVGYHTKHYICTGAPLPKWGWAICHCAASGATRCLLFFGVFFLHIARIAFEGNTTGAVPPRHKTSGTLRVCQRTRNEWRWCSGSRPDPAQN